MMDGSLAAEAGYEVVRADLYNHLGAHLMRKQENDASTRFATKQIAQQFPGEDNLRRYYRSLSPGEVGGNCGLGVDESEFVDRVRERELQPFVATLVFIGAALTAARAFVANVVAGPENNESELPLTEARLEEIFGDFATVHNFRSNQHRFCTLVLFDDESHMVLGDGDTTRLPYMKERVIGRGGFGSVYEVEIPRGHFKVRMGGEATLHDNAKVVARKDYHKQYHAREDFEWERHLCKTILDSPNQCRNVLISYGTIEYSAGFSLLMPKAEYSLREYMKGHEGNNTGSIENLTSHITCAAGLARGVAHLHDGIESREGRVTCYHMDLKPDNVLVFYEGGEMIWKISDFGLSRIKTLVSRDADSTGHPTVSPTNNPAGDGVYLAPESRSPRQMTKKSDVWSLGCIVSEVCVWLQKGWNGVEEYAGARITKDEDAAARFYSPGLFCPTKLNPKVKEWHKKLLQEEGDPAIKSVLANILGYLEDKTFSIEASKRPEARELKSRLEDAAARGNKIAEQATHGQGPGNDLISKLKYKIKPHSGPSSARGWPISFPVQAQRCQFSSDGAILSYYSPEKNRIFLYYGSEKFPKSSGAPLEDISEGHSHYTDIVDIGLTKDYMVIADKADNFRFSLVDFIRDGPCFRHITRIRAGAVPPIYLIAMSPSSDWIACLVKGNESVPGRLYLAKRSKVRPDPNEGGELNPSVWRYRDLPQWTNGEVDNITSLRFSSESSVWFTVKKTSKCRASVSHLSYSQEETQQLKAFKSAAFNAPAADQVACYAPYHRSNKCIIVTTGNILVIHDFDRPTLAGTKKHIDDRFRIIQIVMSGNDQRVLALTEPNHRYGELRLVELSVERDRSKVDVLGVETFEVQYSEYSLDKVQLRWLEPERHTETPNPAPQGSRALIAVLAKPHEKAVFEVYVPPRNPSGWQMSVG